MSGHWSWALLLLAPLHHNYLATASSLAVYDGTQCSGEAVDNVAASNGYPDGQCTHVEASDGSSSSHTSYSFLTLDAGCQITVYGPNTDSDICSGAVLAASLNICYNTTAYPYFSVDQCDSPSSSSSSPSSTSSPTSTRASETSLPSGTSSATTTTTTTASSASSHSSVLTGGDIAGVAISGIAAVTAIVIALIYFRRRPARRSRAEIEGQSQVPPLQQPSPTPNGGRSQHAWNYGAKSSPGSGWFQSGHETPQQEVVEMAYDTRFTSSGGAELPGQSTPAELPARES